MVLPERMAREAMKKNRNERLVRDFSESEANEGFGWFWDVDTVSQYKFGRVGVRQAGYVVWTPNCLWRLRFVL